MVVSIYLFWCIPFGTEYDDQDLSPVPLIPPFLGLIFLSILIYPWRRYEFEESFCDGFLDDACVYSRPGFSVACLLVLGLGLLGF